MRSRWARARDAPRPGPTTVVAASFRPFVPLYFFGVQLPFGYRLSSEGRLEIRPSQYVRFILPGAWCAQSNPESKSFSSAPTPRKRNPARPRPCAMVAAAVMLGGPLARAPDRSPSSSFPVPEASCSAPHLPVSSDTPSVIHLVAFATRHSERMQACWLRWASSMMVHDTTPQLSYRLHLRTHHPGNVSAAALSAKAKVATATTPPGAFQTAAWYAAVNAKMAAWRDLLVDLHAAGRDNDFVIISDLDVAPLQPYSKLLACREHDITFMREPKGHGGSFGPHLVNTGFSLIRNTEQVRAFFTNVCSRNAKYPRLHDQDIANALLYGNLVGHPRARSYGLPSPRGRPLLDWAVFPVSHVTGELEDVSEQTIAFHAIDAQNSTHKLAKLAAVFRRSGTALQSCGGGLGRAGPRARIRDRS